MDTAKMSDKEVIKAALKKAKELLPPQQQAAMKDGIKSGEISVTLLDDWLRMA